MCGSSGCMYNDALVTRTPLFHPNVILPFQNLSNQFVTINCMKVRSRISAIAA